LRETPDDGTRWPFVDAVREARDELLDSALSLDENEREYCTKNYLKFTMLHVLVCSSETLASAEGARQHIESDASLVVEVKDPDASLVVKVEDPGDTEDCREKVLEALRRMSAWHDCDAVVFLSAPGTQQMQVGAMLGGAQFAIDHGAPIRVGALTRDKNGNGTTLLAPQDVPLLPGLDQGLLPVAYGLVMRLELPAAVVILGLLGPRREDLKKAVEALWLGPPREDLEKAVEAPWQGLATWQKPPDAGAAKEALCLIRTALLPDPPETVPEESRALAIALAYLVTEPFKNDKNFEKSQKKAFWDLVGARNSLPMTHGKGSIPEAEKARELLANAERALANAERAMGLNAGAGSLAGRWRACVENWPAFPGDSRESAT